MRLIPILILMTLSGCGKSSLFPNEFELNFNNGNEADPSLDDTPDVGYDDSSRDSNIPMGGTACSNEKSDKNPWLFNDPFYCHQWFLRNVGQKYANLPSLNGYNDATQNGVDYKLNYPYTKKYSGKGVKIYVTDDGLDEKHEDLKNNYISGFDFCENTNTQSSKGNHGTRVTGIMAAEGNNRIGVSGVAPHAKFSVNNLVSNCYKTQEQAVDGVLTQVIGYDLWNGSYTINDYTGWPTRQSYQVTYDAFTEGAMKYGIAYQKASGNDALSGMQSNQDPINSHFAVAVIAAMDGFKTITNYSNPGSNILVSGFGGSGSNSQSGICTTNTLNRYTCNMGATSGATPAITGILALAKEANPNLSWQDLHSLLVMSADPLVDVEFSECGLSKPCIHKTKNNAGYVHNYQSGFGAVNASKLVFLAERSKKLPAIESYQEKYKKNDPIIVSNSNENINAMECSSIPIDIDYNFQAYSAEISIDYKGKLSDLGLFLIMPDGTRGQIHWPIKTNRENLNLDQYIKSMQVFGIDVQGRWMIEACSKTKAIFKKAKLNFYGWSGNKKLPIKSL